MADPLAVAIALLRRYQALEEGAHSFAEWEALAADVDTFLADHPEE